MVWCGVVLALLLNLCLLRPQRRSRQNSIRREGLKNRQCWCAGSDAAATGMRSKLLPAILAIQTRSREDVPRGASSTAKFRVPSLVPRHLAPLSTRRSLTATASSGPLRRGDPGGGTPWSDPPVDDVAAVCRFPRGPPRGTKTTTVQQGKRCADPDIAHPQARPRLQ